MGRQSDSERPERRKIETKRREWPAENERMRSRLRKTEEKRQKGKTGRETRIENLTISNRICTLYIPNSQRKIMEFIECVLGSSKNCKKYRP